jgi:hypothetical protein
MPDAARLQHIDLLLRIRADFIGESAEGEHAVWPVNQQVSTETALRANDGSNLQIVLCQPRIFHDAALSSWFEVCVAMDRDDNGRGIARLLIDAMAASLSNHEPAALLQDATHSLSGDRSQSSIS